MNQICLVDVLVTEKKRNFNVFETADSRKSKLILVERLLFAKDKKKSVKFPPLKLCVYLRKARGNAEAL